MPNCSVALVTTADSSAASADRLRELDREMQSLTLSITNIRTTLQTLEAAYMRLWKEKESIQRSRIHITRLPSRAKPKKRLLSSVPLDELAEFLMSLPENEFQEALEELQGLEGA